MKLILQGIADTDNEMRLKCGVCGGIFDIVAEDIEKVEGVRSYYTTCPNPKCKRSIEIREGSIPRNMRWKVDLRETN